MKNMTGKLMYTIKMYQRDGRDISELIKDVDIRNCNLSGSYIKIFNRINDDISNCNLAQCIIGEDNGKIILSGTKMQNCNFFQTLFKGTLYLKRVDARYCNFNEAVTTSVEYQYGDFRYSKFCNTVWQLGNNVGRNALMSKTVFDKWGLIIE